MANEKTWYTATDYDLPDVSSAANQGKAVLWCLKAFLMQQAAGATLGPEGAAPGGAAWTCYYSCDGAAAGSANDGVDRWTGSYDVTKLVAAAAGSAHSWFVLKSPAALGPYYLIIDMANAVGYQCAIVLCKTAPTGGSTTARPTSTDEVTTGVSQTVADSAAWTATGARVHRCVDAAGNFWFFVGKKGLGVLNTAIGLQTLKNLRMSSDTWPIVLVTDFNASLNVLKDGNSTFIGGGGSGCIRGRGYNGATAFVGSTLRLEYSSGASVFSIQTSPFFGDSLVDTFPATVFTPTATVIGIKGDFYDVKQVQCQSLAQGARYPATGTQEKTLIGSCLVPLSVSPTL